ncbi:MAG: hypothetical protein HQL69_15465 [Magnetococcales bacterium]|nr:hypothetical protein [Magnetococcales bacterium]
MSDSIVHKSRNTRRQRGKAPQRRSLAGNNSNNIKNDDDISDDKRPYDLERISLEDGNGDGVVSSIVVDAVESGEETAENLDLQIEDYVLLDKDENAEGEIAYIGKKEGSEDRIEVGVNVTSFQGCIPAGGPKSRAMMGMHIDYDSARVGRPNVLTGFALKMGVFSLEDLGSGNLTVGEINEGLRALVGEKVTFKYRDRKISSKSSSQVSKRKRVSAKAVNSDNEVEKIIRVIDILSMRKI